MLIKTNVQSASSIVHNGVIYPVVEGIAEVPLEVRDELTKYDHWNDVTEQVDKKVLLALQKAQPSDETPQA